jgi:hypothetical protein
MALIKEDGTIVADANSYADAADADAFQLDRGRAAWCNSGADVKDAALIRATDYIEGRYALSFQGCAIDDVQTLSWPRTAAHYPATGNDFPIDEVPVDVVNACILYAEQVIGPGDDVAAMTELAVTPDIDADGRTVVRLKEKVDVLETDTSFASSESGFVPLRLIRPIPEADRLIRRWLQGGRATLGLTARI